MIDLMRLIKIKTNLDPKSVIFGAIINVLL